MIQAIEKFTKQKIDDLQKTIVQNTPIKLLFYRLNIILNQAKWSMDTQDNISQITSVFYEVQKIISWVVELVNGNNKQAIKQFTSYYDTIKQRLIALCSQNIQYKNDEKNIQITILHKFIYIHDVIKYHTLMNDNLVFNVKQSILPKQKQIQSEIQYLQQTTQRAADLISYYTKRFYFYRQISRQINQPDVFQQINYELTTIRRQKERLLYVQSTMKQVKITYNKIKQEHNKENDTDSYKIYDRLAYALISYYKLGFETRQVLQVIEKVSKYLKQVQSLYKYQQQNFKHLTQFKDINLQQQLEFGKLKKQIFEDQTQLQKLRYQNYELTQKLNQHIEDIKALNPRFIKQHRLNLLAFKDSANMQLLNQKLNTEDKRKARLINQLQLQNQAKTQDIQKLKQQFSQQVIDNKHQTQSLTAKLKNQHQKKVLLKKLIIELAQQKSGYPKAIINILQKKKQYNFNKRMKQLFDQATRISGQNSTMSPISKFTGRIDEAIQKSNLKIQQTIQKIKQKNQQFENRLNTVIDQDNIQEADIANVKQLDEKLQQQVIGTIDIITQQNANHMEQNKQMINVIKGALNQVNKMKQTQQRLGFTQNLPDKSIQNIKKLNNLVETTQKLVDNTQKLQLQKQQQLHAVVTAANALESQSLNTTIDKEETFVDIPLQREKQDKNKRQIFYDMPYKSQDYEDMRTYRPSQKRFQTKAQKKLRQMQDQYTRAFF